MNQEVEPRGAGPSSPAARPRSLWILDDCPIMGGAEHFALRLARLLEEQDSGPRAQLVCPQGSELAARCRDAGIPVEHAAYPPLAPAAAPGIARAVAGMRRTLRAAGPEVVVVANTARAQAYAFAATAGLGQRRRLVHLLHEQDSARRASARLAFRRSGALVAVGSNTARTYERALPGVVVVKINNFLDPAQLEAAAQHRSPARSAGPPRVGVLGRLIPEKGVLELVEELASAPDTWSRLRVAAAPQDAEYARLLAARIAELGLQERVSLLGHVDDVTRFLDGIDVLAVPSTGHEGQPTAILEALAHGRPVLARRPVWSHDFDGLPVIPFDDAASLADALRRLPSEPASLDELARHFGPGQVLHGIDTAAAQAEASTRS